MIAQSVPRPIASVTNGGDQLVLVVNTPWGTTAASDLMPGQPVPLTFSSRAAMILTQITW